MKTCYTCKGTFYEEKFVKKGTGRLNQCKKCANKAKKASRSTPEARQKQKEYRETNKERQKHYMRDYHQRKTYGITFSDKEGMLERQGGVCAMCKTEKPGGTNNIFHTDHNHITGKVRALLCFKCNRDLGYYELHKSKCEDYLEEYDGA